MKPGTIHFHIGLYTRFDFSDNVGKVVLLLFPFRGPSSSSQARAGLGYYATPNISPPPPVLAHRPLLHPPSEIRSATASRPARCVESHLSPRAQGCHRLGPEDLTAARRSAQRRRKRKLQATKAGAKVPTAPEALGAPLRRPCYRGGVQGAETLGASAAPGGRNNSSAAAANKGKRTRRKEAQEAFARAGVTAGRGRCEGAAQPPDNAPPESRADGGGWTAVSAHLGATRRRPRPRRPCGLPSRA
ncbi:uncharacterized protein LOC142449166 [Tenrec ecaudatus]|uniref:uncharacterized protein LOC142449166 n=1 Tax=Tenrec ecaudatus TaxID=94439 RepID=UPI003F5924AF